MAKIFTTTHRVLKVLTVKEVEKDYSSLERQYFDGFILEPHIVEISVLVKRIGKNAFKNSKNLVGVSFSDSVEEISDSAFENCKNLGCENFDNESFTHINLNKTKTLGKDVFKNCTELKVVNLGCVKEIFGNCFENCCNLEEVLGFETLTHIDPTAFVGCELLTELNQQDLESELKCLSIDDLTFNLQQVSDLKRLCIELKKIQRAKNKLFDLIKDVNLS